MKIQSKNEKHSNKKLTVIDLFAGAGGVAWGFKKSGFEVLAANDLWGPASLTYKENHKDVNYILKDICQLDGLELLAKSGMKVGEVDVIIGCPPCQGFSTAGMRASGDTRNDLFKEYLRIVNTVRPKIFVMENVKGILSMESGDVLQNIIDSSLFIGYGVGYRVLNSSDFGVPQNRERVFFIGVRSDLDIDIDNIFQELFNLSNTIISKNNLNPQKPLTIWDAISDLPIINSGQESIYYDKVPQNEYQRQMRNECEVLTMHSTSNHSSNMLEMMKYIPEGGSAFNSKDMPEHLVPTSGFCNSYGRLNSNEPGMTITRNFGCISSARCIHPFQDRSLTAREAARIQSFKDKYIFMGTKSDIALQIGNSVPPLLAAAISKAITNVLKDK